MKEEAKKEEGKILDQTVEKTETELRSDMGQLLQEFEALELQMRNLKAGVSADSLDPTDNYSFTRMVIEGEVETLSAAVSGVQQRLNNEVDMLLASLAKAKQLIFLVQDRQEKMYAEFTEKLSLLDKADRERQEDIMKLESISNESIKKLEGMIAGSAESSMRALYDKIDSLEKKMRHNIKMMSEEFDQKSQVLQGETSEKLNMNNSENIHAYKQLSKVTDQSFKILAQYLLRLAQETGHRKGLAIHGLDSVMSKLESTGRAT